MPCSRAFLVSAGCWWPLAQSNPHAKEAHSGVVYSGAPHFCPDLAGFLLRLGCAGSAKMGPKWRPGIGLGKICLRMVLITLSGPRRVPGVCVLISSPYKDNCAMGSVISE